MERSTLLAFLDSELAWLLPITAIAFVVATDVATPAGWTSSMVDDAVSVAADAATTSATDDEADSDSIEVVVVV